MQVGIAGGLVCSEDEVRFILLYEFLELDYLIASYLIDLLLIR